MRLPSHVIKDEDRPFLRSANGERNKAHDAMDGLSKSKSGERGGAWMNVLLLSKKPLVRWVLLVALLLALFVFSSSMLQYGTSGNEYDSEVPDLDFNLENVISASIGLSQMAGDKIVEIKHRHTEDTQIKGKTAEGVDEPVTVADRESNKIFINGFRSLFGGDLSLVSEEDNPAKDSIVPPLDYVTFPGGDRLLDKEETVIIIDPLDATKEFTEERDTDGSDMLLFVTTLVCVVQNGKPIAGVVNRPFVSGEEIMWAVVTDEYTQVNHVKVTPPGDDASQLVTVSRSHAGGANDVVAKYLAPRKSLPAGGAGYKTWLVLTGQVEAYIHVTKIKIWDMCAGHALLLAAGGDITDKGGVELTYSKDAPMFENGIVATLDSDKIKEYVAKLKDVTVDQKK